MPTITKSDELRLYNRARILECLRRSGRQSRTALGDNTGLSAATVTQVTSGLIDDGVIEQVTRSNVADAKPAVNTRRGRPQVLLGLRPNAATTAVLTLLLNEIEVTLYDYVGNQLHNIKSCVVTAELSAAALEKHVYATLDAALGTNESRYSSLKHIALVCQGTVTSDNSGLLWSPIIPVRDFDFRSKLRARYGVWVTVANDCNTIANALYIERQKRASAEHARTQNMHQSTSEDNFAAILSSYGIGIGIYHKGSILTGSHSSGTEFGHMLFKSGGALCRCGRYGCIEAYAANYAIWRRAKELPSDMQPIDVVPAEEYAGLVEVAKRRPGPERDAFVEAGAAIGQGLANLFAIFDPFPACLVGISASAFSLMEKSLTTSARHYDTGTGRQDISVYDKTDQSELIRIGASQQALSYIDKNVFGFGERDTLSRELALS